MKADELIQYLEELAPLELAEGWDNVGLLLGDRNRDVKSVLTCLTLTSNVAAEAIERGVTFVISHHPILFRAIQRITTETVAGRMLLDLIAARIAVYSPHTSYDSARDGINRQLASMFDLQDVRAIRPITESVSGGSTDITGADRESFGGGRYGRLPNPVPLAQFVESVKQRLGLDGIQYVGEPEQIIERVGIACGSAAEFLSDAVACGCQALLTGEARFHACLEAQDAGVGMILPGHYATERPAMESLAERLTQRFPELHVRASDVEADPIRWL